MKDILMGRFRKEEVVELLNHDPERYKETFNLALENHALVSWRAAWVLYHAMSENDSRLLPFVSQILAAIPGKGDGHQRELLRILEKLEIPEDCEGPVFDTCMNIWEQVGKIPSVRIFAFRILNRIANRYPELKTEIAFLSQPQYTETLSPGIRNSVERMMGRN